MIERAYAKINLCLDVVGEREDGYHELRMIMIPLNFYDILTIEPASETSLSINRSFLPVNEKNTVIKAIRLIQERYGITQEFACTLNKHIPTQAGLAGGSADAAAAIRILNKMCSLNLSVPELLDLGKHVGADVPFCILNQPALVEGIGETIHPFTMNTDFEILLVKPRKGVSTAAAFSALKENTMIHPDCDRMRTALENNDYDTVISSLGNTLEEVSMELVPQIREIKEDMYAFGFDGVLMSGSGSTVFGITRSPKLMESTLNIMRNKGYFVRKTKPLTNHSGD